MSAKGTSHHKAHGLAGLIMIITLPLFLWGLCGAISGKAAGFTDWMNTPFGAVSLMVFLTSAIFYMKMEMDEIILDYLSGGTQNFATWANRLVAFAAWAIAVYVIVKTWTGV